MNQKGFNDVVDARCEAINSDGPTIIAHPSGGQKKRHRTCMTLAFRLYKAYKLKPDNAEHMP
jgi:hypothetical protein